MKTRSITGAGVPYPSNHTLAHDAANRLISAMPQPPGSATTYGYDGHDRRVAATPPGGVTKLTMYSKAGQLLSEIRTNGLARVNYVYLGRHLLARVPYNSFGTGGGGLGSAPPKLFQHTDGLGTPIAVTDASGDAGSALGLLAMAVRMLTSYSKPSANSVSSPSRSSAAGPVTVVT